MLLKLFKRKVYYDPLLSREEIKWFGVRALDELKQNFDCVITTVAHNEFKKMKLEDVKKMLNDKPVLVDVRGMFDGEVAKEKGFYYESL